MTVADDLNLDTAGGAAYIVSATYRSSLTTFRPMGRRVVSS